jgi:hypothetical protein
VRGENATKNVIGKLGTKQGGVVVPLNDPTQLSVTRMQFLAADKLGEDIKAIKMEFQDSDFTSPEVKLSTPPIRKRPPPGERGMRQVLKKMFQNKLDEGLPGHQDMVSKRITFAYYPQDVCLSDEEGSDRQAQTVGEGRLKVNAIRYVTAISRTADVQRAYRRVQPWFCE